MPQLDIKPAFQAERVEGKFYRMVMGIEEDVRKVGPNQDKSIIVRKLVPRREEFTSGYMVYFPQGHSMFVAEDDVDQLRRIGVLEEPPLVDMASGELVPGGFNMTPKEIVERKQRNRPRPTQGGITEALEG